MMTCMTFFWMSSQFAQDSKSGTKSFESCLHTHTVAAKWTTSGHTRTVSRPVHLDKSLNEDVNDIICYMHKGDNPNKQWHIALPQQVLEETIECKELRFIIHKGNVNSTLEKTVTRTGLAHNQTKSTTEMLNFSHMSRDRWSWTITIIMLACATCHCNINEFWPFNMGPWTVCSSVSLDQNVSDLPFTFQWIKALAPPMDQAQRVHEWFSYTIISNPDITNYVLMIWLPSP